MAAAFAARAAATSPQRRQHKGNEVTSLFSLTEGENIKCNFTGYLDASWADRRLLWLAPAGGCGLGGWEGVLGAPFPAVRRLQRTRGECEWRPVRAART